MSARTGDAAGNFGREPPPNPFGNYSFMEAQRTSGTPNEPGRPPAQIKENPFFSYSFMEAQNHGSADPKSPVKPTGKSKKNSFDDEITELGIKLRTFESQDEDKPEPTNAPQPSSFNSVYENSAKIADTGGQYTAMHELEEGNDSIHFNNIHKHGSASIEQQVIRMLYEEFRDRAASKIDAIVELRLDREPDLAKYLDRGADPAFDRTLEKLGVLARRRPRVIIELLLVWRKTTIDAADDYPFEGSSHSAIGAHTHSQGAISEASGRQPAAALSRAHYIIKERKSLVSVYILCRALGSVVRQLEASHLEGDLGDRLEELVFSQVKQVNATNLRRSQNRREIQDLYARLIGRISEIRFASMSDRFIAELERIPMVSGSGDERIVILLHNMRFLKLRVYPIDALEESSAFLLSCAKFYSRTSGSMRLKHAWATLLTELIMPIAAVVDVEVNFPELVQAIDIIHAKAMKMAAKVRHVNVAFPLAAATLCISRKEVFHQRWLSLLEYCIQRLKDKQFRRVSMDAILRMLWVYLFRHPEASSVVLRRIDSLSRIFFPATKLHAWPKTVPPSAFVYFLVCAACYNFDFTMRQLLQGMLQVDNGWPGTTRDLGDAGPILDTLNPARVGIAFQALINVAAIANSNGSANHGALNSTATNSTKTSGAATASGQASSETAKSPSYSGDSSNTGRSAISFHPPFPGVEQLSGLDIFGLDSSSLCSNTSTNPTSYNAASSATASAASNTLGAACSSATGAVAASAYPGLGGTENCSRKATDIIYSNSLPSNIRNALKTAVSVVARYCNLLYPVFGHYALADERLWRLTRTVPPFSSVVLTGSPFNIENTMMFLSGAANRDQRTLHGSHTGGSTSGALKSGGVASSSGGGGIGASGSANTGGPVGGVIGSSSGAGAASSPGPAAAGAAASRALAMGDDMSDSYYLDSQGSSGAGGTGAGGSSADELAAAASIRQIAARYPSERQVYVDLMVVYTRNVPRAQVFWEKTDPGKIIDSLVQSVLHIDQPLAAESRACLLDLLSPLPGLRSSGTTNEGDRINASTMFTSKLDRLNGIAQAVVRATQLLRATDERFSEILAGGIFTLDTRSCVPFAQPGDPLADAIGSLTYGLPPIGDNRRFAHASSLSTASNASNGVIFEDRLGRQLSGFPSDFDARSESAAVRHAYSLSGQLGDDDSDIDAETSSAAVAAAAAALDTKARLQKSMRSSDLVSHELNGGFLHVYLDLISYLEISIYEYLAETNVANNSIVNSGDGAGLSIEAQAASSSNSTFATPEIPSVHGDRPGSSKEQIASETDDGSQGPTSDNRSIGSRSLVEWARLICAIEANVIALLCSSSIRVRRLAVDVLYQAGILRRVIAANEPIPPVGYGWIFKNVDSAYDVLNVLVPPVSPRSLQASAPSVTSQNPVADVSVTEFWDVPFGAENASIMSTRSSQPLAKLAASAREADICLWNSYFPVFIKRASVQIPETMLIARTLVCQRLYQMQPLMNQYAEMSVKLAGLGSSSSVGSVAHLRLTNARPSDKAAASVFRPDFVTSFGCLFLFAVVSLPASDPLSRSFLSGNNSIGDTSSSTGANASKGLGVISHSGLVGDSGSSTSSIFGNSSNSNISSSGGGGGGRSRLAKSIARKLAPLKSSSRGNKQEQGVGLASISQLVRIASVLLRSDNAPLRQLTSYAICNTPSIYLYELMQELRPLAESLFDDGSSLASHRNYLHVSSVGGITAGGGSGLIASLTHGSSSPGSSVLNVLGSSPKVAAQLAPHVSSKRKPQKVGNSALAYDVNALGSDTEATSDSGNSKTAGSINRTGSNNNGNLANQTPGRRANSFDAAAMGSKQHTDASGYKKSHHNDLAAPGANTSASSSANAAAVAAAAAAAAAVNAGTGSGTASQIRRKRLRLSLAQIYKHVSRQLDLMDHHGHALYHDEQIMSQLISYIRETKTFLSESPVQSEWEHQPLRIHFCGLVEALYYYISSAKSAALHSTAHAGSKKGGSSGLIKASSRFTHETRNGLYQLFERWCCLGRYSEISKDTQSRMIGQALDQLKGTEERAYLASVLEEDCYLLNLSSLRTMAVLCKNDPSMISAKDIASARTDLSGFVEPGGPRDKVTLFSWISDALNHQDPRVQCIGQRAVKWTIVTDPKDTAMVRILIQLAYGISVTSSVNNGFAAMVPAEGSGSIANQSTGHGTCTSGLGLMLGAASASTKMSDMVQNLAAPATNAPLTLSTDKIALGYLCALTAILSQSNGSAYAHPSEQIYAGRNGKADHTDSESENSEGNPISKSLSLSYVGVVLPLVMFQLQSERHKIRRQALLILRVLCMHLSKEECLAMLDRLGPSIVSDIPAIASEAAVRLISSVANSFNVYSDIVTMEIVRQIHAQSTYGGRFSLLQAIMRPWLANVCLASDQCDNKNDDSMDSENSGFRLCPGSLSRKSLLALRCMLYMTVKADLSAMADMQGLWLALVDGTGSHGDYSRSRNIWLVMQYLTSLLMRFWTPTLLGFVRRIAVFLTRSVQGLQLVHNLIEETMKPAAAIPIDADDSLAQNNQNESLPSEPWASEIPFLTQPSSDQGKRPLLSTSALAMFYLGAISYEHPELLASYKSLAVLPSALFLLAHPEQWVRDAARTVLVNLVASERSRCIALSYGSYSNGTKLMPLVDLSYIANDAAHAALTVLRGSECAAGFGNVEETAMPGSKTTMYQHTDSRTLNESNDFLFHGWSPIIPARAPSRSDDTDLFKRNQSANENNRRDLENEQDDDNEESLSHSRHFIVSNTIADNATRKLSDIHTDESSAGVDVADPSLVADVADIPTAMSQTTSPTEGVNGALGATASSSSVVGVHTQPHSPVVDSDPRRRSSTTSRRSMNSEYVADGGTRERATLQRFMVNLSRLFSSRYFGCAQEWADVAVQWAMSCPVRPLAGLSLQVFSVLVAEAQFGGALVITPTRQMVLRLVDRLSNVVGDPSLEFSSFAETVLTGLKQTAGLAARMCAEDEEVKADLLATSLVLMRTAQSASIYSMSLGIFERIFPLVETDEFNYRAMVVERTGTLCAEGYQPILLRGLEFASCRDRCLRLLRSTLKYDIPEHVGEGGVRNNNDSSHPPHAMLSIVAHIPMLMVDSMQHAINVQRSYLDSTREPVQPNPSIRISASEITADATAMANFGRGRNRHNYRRPRAPSFSGNPFSTSLGLMFGGTKGDVEKNRVQTTPDMSNYSEQASPIASTGSSSRLQLFRRRANASQTQKDSSGSKESLVESEVTSILGRESELAAITHSSIKNDSRGSLHTSQSYGSVRSGGIDDRGILHEKYVAFISQCSQAVLSITQSQTSGQMSANHQPSQSRPEMRETTQFLHALMCLLAPPSGPSTVQYAFDLAREVTSLFGYAIVECGQQCVTETIGILLQFLQPSNRTRLALKYIGDEQATRIIGQPSSKSLVSAMGLLATGYVGELRRIDACLQLLHSVLLASSSDSGLRGSVFILDASMMPSLRHLFDLLIVARPISDLASQVLQILLQRFDDVPVPAMLSEIKWYESDPLVLLNAGRSALGRVVALGIGPSNTATSYSTFAINGGQSNMDDGSVRSTTPEMPVLNIVSDVNNTYTGSSEQIMGEERAGQHDFSIPSSFTVSPHLLQQSSGNVTGGHYVVDYAADTHEAHRYTSSVEEDAYSLSNNESHHQSDAENNNGDDDGDLLAQLDEFDRELDEALQA
ncbi:Cell morphogenesis protein PAG1 [Coemansia umbellata]|uniref:Cell morphogenesis protein PAG1 n=1 Tax=Coemansia umbellata TaxID=1424467 RepID=A0ABQ8PGS4_9FUNG|nr:Cell morphogenesis protein PAG1 [Coemansia umbellata]